MPSAEHVTPAPSLFRNLPDRDWVEFGEGDRFDAKKVTEWLDLKKSDVSRITDVAQTSVRWDSAMPGIMRDRLEEIAVVINSVAQVFDGDSAKTALWFRTRNPMLGDVAPRDMIRLGRFDRLRRFIINAMVEHRA